MSDAGTDADAALRRQGWCGIPLHLRVNVRRQRREQARQHRGRVLRHRRGRVPRRHHADRGARQVDQDDDAAYHPEGRRACHPREASVPRHDPPRAQDGQGPRIRRKDGHLGRREAGRGGRGTRGDHQQASRSGGQERGRARSHARRERHAADGDRRANGTHPARRRRQAQVRLLSWVPHGPVPRQDVDRRASAGQLD